MKAISIICAGALALVAGCGQPQKEVKQKALQEQSLKPLWTPPSSGEEVANFKEKILEDKLNDLYFSVSVVATDSSRDGLYKVIITYGYAENETSITLPKWTNDVYLKPVLQEGDEPYKVLLGFEAEDDTFHSYYEIKAIKGAVKMEKVMDYQLVTP